VLDAPILDGLFKAVEAVEAYHLLVNLEQQTISKPDGETISFDVDAFRKYCLLHGLDDIGLTLQHADSIKAYEERRRQEAPWLFG